MSEYLDIARTCVLQNLRSAARAVTRAYEAALAEVDLSASQFSTLVAVRIDDGVPVSVLAGRVGMDRTTMTRVLAPLDRRGLIDLRRSERDARATGVFLTQEGTALLEQALPLWRGIQEDMLGRLGRPDWPAMKEALDQLKT